MSLLDLGMLGAETLVFSQWIWLLSASEKDSRLCILSICFVFLKKESKLMYHDSQHPTSPWKILPLGASALVYVCQCWRGPEGRCGAPAAPNSAGALFL